MSHLFQLIYISTARGEVSTADCNALLTTARLRNRRNEISGLLMFNGKRFLQVLEGEETQVRTVFGRIKNNPRHIGIVVLTEKQVEAREFGAWAMAFDDGSASDVTLRQKVTALLEGTGPSTRALFETTADFHRIAG